MIHNFSAHLTLPWPFQACWWPNRELCKLKTNFFATHIFFTKNPLGKLLRKKYAGVRKSFQGREVERSRGRDLAWQVAFGIRTFSEVSNRCGPFKGMLAPFVWILF